MRPSPAAPPYAGNDIGVESYLSAALTSIVRAHVEGVNSGFDMQQRKVDALVACCEATLRYLEGPACMEVCDELAACEGVIAMLRAALERAK